MSDTIVGNMFRRVLKLVREEFRSAAKGGLDLPRAEDNKLVSGGSLNARSPFLSSPLGANFAPKDEFCPLGVTFSVCPSILLNSRGRFFCAKKQ
jgi:hypothetical protein